MTATHCVEMRSGQSRLNEFALTLHTRITWTSTVLKQGKTILKHTFTTERMHMRHGRPKLPGFHSLSYIFILLAVLKYNTDQGQLSVCREQWMDHECIFFILDR